MEIFGAIILFILFILIYMIIAEIFVMLFRVTGIPEEMARFQVISMLTNSGFTTKEANIMINSKIRRTLTKFVMLFGYAFTVTIVSALVNIFLQFKNTFIVSSLFFVPIILIIVSIGLFIHKSKWIRRNIENLINFIAFKLIYKQNVNPIIIIEKLEDLVIARVLLRALPAELDNIKLAESSIKADYGINILYKKTPHGESGVEADTILKSGDSIVVIGEEKKIRYLFEIKENSK